MSRRRMRRTLRLFKFFLAHRYMYLPISVLLVQTIIYSTRQRQREGSRCDDGTNYSRDETKQENIEQQDQSTNQNENHGISQSASNVLQKNHGGCSLVLLNAWIWLVYCLVLSKLHGFFSSCDLIGPLLIFRQTLWPHLFFPRPPVQITLSLPRPLLTRWAFVRVSGPCLLITKLAR